MKLIKSLLTSVVLSATILSSAFASSSPETPADTSTPTVQIVQGTPNMDELARYLSNDVEKFPGFLSGMSSDLQVMCLSKITFDDLASLGQTDRTMHNVVVTKLMWPILKLLTSTQTLSTFTHPWKIPHAHGCIFGDYNRTFNLYSLVEQLLLAQNDNPLKVATMNLLNLTPSLCVLSNQFRTGQSAVLGVQAAHLLLANPGAIRHTYVNPSYDPMVGTIADPARNVICPNHLLNCERLVFINMPFLQDTHLGTIGGMGDKYLMHAVDIHPAFSKKLRDCCILTYDSNPNSQLADLAALTYARLVMRTYPRTMDEVRFAAKAMLKIKDFMFVDSYLTGAIAFSLISNGEHGLSSIEGNLFGATPDRYVTSRSLTPAPEVRDHERKKQDLLLVCDMIAHCIDLGGDLEVVASAMTMGYIIPHLNLGPLRLFKLKNPETFENQKQLFIDRHLDSYFK